MIEYGTAGGQTRHRVSLEATNNARLVSPSDSESVYMRKPMDKPVVGCSARVCVLLDQSRPSQQDYIETPRAPSIIVQSYYSRLN